MTGGASGVGCGAYHTGDGQRTLGAQTPLAALQLDLSVDHRRRPGLAERLDQPGDPGMPPSRDDVLTPIRPPLRD
jgi:hypothetical protein